MSVKDNDFERIADAYRLTEGKPDKLFSILPTVLRLAGVHGCEVLDLGCGEGFFARGAAAAGASKVIGIDNSQSQLDRARCLENPGTIEYRLADIFHDDLPTADVVLAPFVLNYAETSEALRGLLANIRQALRPGGRCVGVVDLPTGRDLRKYGAQKTLSGKGVDGDEITIQLFNSGSHLCTLHSIYYCPATVETLCREVGFANVTWYQPIVSQEGVEQFGDRFWRGYAKACDLGYFVAEVGA